MSIFLDNNASTRVDDDVVQAMLPYFTTNYTLPSSEFGYSMGIEVKAAVDHARALISQKLNCEPTELIFDSDSSEGISHIIKGIALMHVNDEKKLLLASKISRQCVLESMESMKRFGFEVKLIDVDPEGKIKLDHLKELLKEAPILVSIPHVSAEIGTIDNVSEIARICHGKKALLHVEASYSFCKVPIDVKAMQMDFLTITAHLIHGPKGIGAEYIKKGIKLLRLIDGGTQEFKQRAGIENIPGIIGFAKAVELYDESVNHFTLELRNYLWDLLNQKLVDFEVTGTPSRDPAQRLNNHLSIVVLYVEGESILLHLDMLGFMVATGSACANNLKSSHVLTAIGLPIEVSHGSIRLAVCKYTKKEELADFVKNLVTIIAKLREISPINADFMREWREKKARGEVEEEEHDHDHELEE